MEIKQNITLPQLTFRYVQLPEEDFTAVIAKNLSNINQFRNEFDCFLWIIANLNGKWSYVYDGSESFSNLVLFFEEISDATMFCLTYG